LAVAVFIVSAYEINPQRLKFRFYGLKLRKLVPLLRSEYGVAGSGRGPGASVVDVDVDTDNCFRCVVVSG